MNNKYKIAKIVLIVVAVILVSIETIVVFKIVNTSRIQKNESKKQNEVLQNESVKAIEESIIDSENNNMEKDKELIKKIDSMKMFRESDLELSIDDFETVKYGKYPQTDKYGKKYEDIEWLLLARENGFALLLCKDIVDAKKYNETTKDMSWENSDVRKWLNGEFYDNAFSDYEKEKIAKTPIVNLPNIIYKTSSGKNTSDKVELMSESEALVYLTIKNKGKTATKYAAKDTSFAKEKIAYENSYWLRSTGMDKTKASYISKNGEMINKGIDIETVLGIRPTIWVQYKIIHNNE